MKKIKIYTSSSLILSIIVSFLFALTAFLDSGLTYFDDIFATAEQIHFNPYTARSYVIFAVYLVTSFLVVTLVCFLGTKIHIRYVRDAKKPDKRAYVLWFIVFVLLICAWLPYILSYFPGGVYPDTATSIGHARTGQYNNQQPMLYALLFRLCIVAFGELNAVMAFSIAQALFMAISLSYIIYRLYLHEVNKPVLVLIFAYFAFFNLIPLYVVSIWKDTLFSTVLLMFIFALAEGVLLSGRKPHKSEIVKVIFWMLLVIFLRNNGIYVMLLTVLSLLIVFRKSILKEHKAFFVSVIAVLICSYIIQGPVFSRLGLNGPFVENLGVLQQQIAYVQVIGGDMTEDQADFLSKVCPLDTMKGYYRPLVVDTIKWCSEYDSDFLEANKLQYIKVWAGMIKDNPKLYADAYLYITLGYWNPFKQSSISYVNPEMWGDLQNIDRYWQTDIIENMTASSIRESLMPKTYISSAVFLFIALVLFILSIKKKDKAAYAFIPALFTYLTVFIATPLAFALRYVYIVVLAAPLFVVFAFLRAESCTDQKTKNTDNKTDNAEG